MGRSKKAEIKDLRVRISRIDGVMGGKWCLAGTRIPLSLVLRYLELGYSVKKLKKEIWPHIKEIHLLSQPKEEKG